MLLAIKHRLSAKKQATINKKVLNKNKNKNYSFYNLSRVI